MFLGKALVNPYRQVKVQEGAVNGCFRRGTAGKTRRDTYVGASLWRKRLHLHLNIVDNGFHIEYSAQGNVANNVPAHMDDNRYDCYTLWQ